MPSQLCSPCGRAFLDQLRLQQANRPVLFSPNREPESFERGLPCRPDQQWPSARRTAGDDPISKPRLHASSTHTRGAMQARLGRVFLSDAGDLVLAKAHGLADSTVLILGETGT